MTINEPYAQYLEAANRVFGPLAVGKYGVSQGKLVKKLDRDEFSGKYEAFKDLDRLYKSLSNSGVTIDDAIYQELKALAAELLMDEKNNRFQW